MSFQFVSKLPPYFSQIWRIDNKPTPLRFFRLRESTPFSELTSAVLAAMNIADRYYKSQASVENMRAQIRSYADECAHLRSELNKLKKK